jgi:hypothetical protein
MRGLTSWRRKACKGLGIRADAADIEARLLGGRAVEFAFAVYDQIGQKGGEQRVLGLGLAQLAEHLDEVDAADGALQVTVDRAAA